jgi:hypothetical protein
MFIILFSVPCDFTFAQFPSTTLSPLPYFAYVFLHRIPFLVLPAVASGNHSVFNAWSSNFFELPFVVGIVNYDLVCIGLCTRILASVLRRLICMWVFCFSRLRLHVAITVICVCKRCVLHWCQVGHFHSSVCFPTGEWWVLLFVIFDLFCNKLALYRLF